MVDAAMKRNKKIVSYTELLLMAALLVVLNGLGNFIFFRIDLTKEKRYTLSESSKNLAEKLDDKLTAKIYLEGNFPAGFKRLQNATREMIDEFNVYAGTEISYEFIDPLAGLDKKTQNDVIEQLQSKGLQPINLQVNADDELSSKIIFPGVLFYYKGKEYPINLLKGQFGDAPESVINASIENIEYEIGNVLRKCTMKGKKKLAFLIGNGELGKYETGDISQELGDFYQIERLDFTLQPPQKLQEYAGLVIAKPQTAFSEYDKFKLDQYVMKGGKILWLIDPVIAEMDSMKKETSFTSVSNPLNLDDMLFKYGARLNSNLIEDMTCNRIPILTNIQGSSPQTRLVPWIYYPLLSSSSKHPIVNNLDVVWAQFASSIDTTSNTRCRKTVLLESSTSSRVAQAPVLVDLGILRKPMPTGIFNQSHFPVAVLLEGKFESIFENRKIFDSVSKELKYTASIDNNKMIVISDGDIIRNQVSKSSGSVYPLGYDRYTKQFFGNKKFILNCIDYLCDDSGIIEVRSREIQLRLLDKQLINSDKLKWQLINLLLPVILIVIFGWIYISIRKRRYA